jgi:MFS family permease
VLLVALGIFTVGAIVASVANNSAVLLVGRSIQGIGGGGLVALTYIIVTDLVTLRERGKWFALISLQWAIGSVLGPVVGGAVAENSNWRWIFWLNLPFCVITIPVCLKLTHKVGSILEKLRAFDWFGSFLFIGSLTSFLIPVTWGKSHY